MDTLLVQNHTQLSLHLRALRKMRALTQAQLAQRLGITQSRYAQIETNPGAVSTEQLFQVFAALQVDLLLQPRVSKSAPKKPARGEDW